jgi:hypothetical protein
MMSEAENTEVEEPVGGRYGRGGYRNKTRRVFQEVEVGAEKPLEEEKPIALDANLLDGDSLGPQDPNNFPTEDSDVGGPVDLSKGGGGVPSVGRPTPPALDGDREREIEVLEKEVEDDPELTPEVDESEEQELVETPPPPEPQPTPEDLPSDDEMAKELDEEPADEEKTEGEGLTMDQVEEEGIGSESAEAAEQEETPVEEPPAEEDEDEVEISAVDEEEKGETFE